MSQAVSPGQSTQATPGTEAGQAFNLTASQCARILQAVLEQNQTGVAIVSADSRIQHVNFALAELLRCERTELIGRVLEGLVLSGNLSEGNHRRTGPPPDERRTLPAINQLTRKSGETISCFVDSCALPGADGKTAHYIVFISDAQAGKDAEELSRFERSLFQLQSLQILGTLAGGIAHDFNNALEVIMGFASLARSRLSASDPLFEPLKIIEESAMGAADLARQLLDVSKDTPDDARDIEAGDLISAVIAIISRTFDRKVRIEHRIAPELPRVRGVRNRLEQAILNLCINARDALQEGGVLALEAASQVLRPGDPRLPLSNEPGHYVRISVRDSGAGMTAEVMEQIFNPHFTTKGPGRGYGLGLSMVDRIVKEARGFISVSSRPGEGSEFSLYLPAVFSDAPRAATSRPNRLMSGRGKVLVVDDEPRVLEFLEKGLTRLGYEVVPAESGSRACEIYSRQSDEINCVLLDLIMPGLSGLETYGRLRDINPRVKVILSSGYSSGRLKRDIRQEGSPEFLEKPYTLQELSQVLQKIQQN